MKNRSFKGAVAGSLLALFLLLPLIIVSPSTAKADGMLVEPFSNRWDFADESAQNALITYKDGTEKMLISIGYNQNAKAVWLFPVPALPDQVRLDVVAQAPELSGGFEVGEQLKYNTHKSVEIMMNAQIYPIIMNGLLIARYGGNGGVSSGLSGELTLSTADSQSFDGVEVSEHIEKEGLISELITAKSAEALQQYFKKQNLSVPDSAVSAFKNYVGGNYSIVASWINPIQASQATDGDLSAYGYQVSTVYKNDTPSLFYIFLKYKDTILDFGGDARISNVFNPSVVTSTLSDPNTRAAILADINKDPQAIFELKNYLKNGNSENQKAVSISFPTSKVFFPLMPTSAYGEKKVPATIRVVGDFTPNIFENIKPYSEIIYYQDANLDDNRSEKIDYTKVVINAPSSQFTEDLIFDSGVPIKMRLAKTFNNHPDASALLVWALICFISAGLVGLFVFRANQAKAWTRFWHYGILGLFNLLSLLGFLIATILWPTKDIKDEDADLLLEMRVRGYSVNGLRAKDVRKIYYIILTMVLYMLLVWIFDTKIINIF